MVISSDSSVERSNKVIAPARYVSSKGGIGRSSGLWGENLGVVVAAFLTPGPVPEEMQPLLVQEKMVGQVK